MATRRGRNSNIQVIIRMHHKIKGMEEEVGTMVDNSKVMLVKEETHICHSRIKAMAEVVKTSMEVSRVNGIIKDKCRKVHPMEIIKKQWHPYENYKID